MKIAMIDTKLDLETGGGSNYHLNLVASELVKLGHDVTVILLQPSRNSSYPADLPYPVVQEGLLTGRFTGRFTLELLRVLRKYENQFDIYHLNHGRFLLGGALYRRFGGKVPVMVYLVSVHCCTNRSRIDLNCARHCTVLRRVMHQEENPMKKALLLPYRALENALEMRMANSVDAFLPCTQTWSKIYSWWHLDSGKMNHYPVVINYEYLHGLRESCRAEPFADGAYNIIYVGRLEHFKGVDILIKAIPKLDFHVRLHIAGDGPQKKELELLVKELGISDRVVFHGWVPHEKVADLHLNSQLFVYPPRWPELFCNSVVEAMALGMPIIASDYGDIASELDGAALPFKRADTDDLVEKIKLVHDTPSMAASLAEKAQEKAKEFDHKRVISRYIEVCRAIIERQQA